MSNVDYRSNPLHQPAEFNPATNLNSAAELVTQPNTRSNREPITTSIVAQTALTALKTIPLIQSSRSTENPNIYNEGQSRFSPINKSLIPKDKINSIETQFPSQEPLDKNTFSQEFLHADMARKKLDESSEVDIMSIPEKNLLDFFKTHGKNLNHKELNLLKDRIFQFNAKKTESDSKEIQVEKQESAQGIQKSQKADGKSQKSELHKAYILSKDGTSREATAEDIESVKNGSLRNSFAEFENGVLKLSKEMAATGNFKIGDKFNGAEIKDIKILSEDELDAHINNFLNPSNIEAAPTEEHSHEDAATANINHHYEEIDDKNNDVNEALKNLIKEINLKRLMKELNTARPSDLSTQKRNEKRLKSFFEAMDEKFANIKAEINKYNLSHSNIQSDNSKREIKIDFTKLLQETAKEMEKLLNDLTGEPGIEIPLATIQNVKTIEVAFDQYQQTSPAVKENMEKFMEKITTFLTKEVMNILSSKITSNKQFVGAPTTQEGKTGLGASAKK